MRDSERLDDATARVITRMRFDAAPEAVWQGLRFYEEIDARPPLILRLFLPIPVRTEGRVEHVGDEARCVYRTGHLCKQLTRIEPDRVYEFAVTEQALAVGGGLRLSGGRYTLHPLADGTTDVEVETRYTSRRRPRWLFTRVERWVCHAFHRYLLGAMRRQLVLDQGGASHV